MSAYFLFVPVYLNLYGRFNYKKLLDEGTEEDRADLEKYFDYVDAKVACDSAANNGGDGVVTIIDWEGFSLGNYNSPEGKHHLFSILFLTEGILICFHGCHYFSVSHLPIKQLGKLGKLYNAIKQTYSVNSKQRANSTRFLELKDKKFLIFGLRFIH